MGARLSRTDKATAESSVDRRKEPRFPALSKAQVESARGETDEVQIVDVSLHGCSVRECAEWLRAGRFVSIAINGNPPLQAVIRWVRDASAGMEFLRPLPANRTEWRELIDAPF